MSMKNCNVQFVLNKHINRVSSDGVLFLSLVQVKEHLGKIKITRTTENICMSVLE